MLKIILFCFVFFAFQTSEKEQQRFVQVQLGHGHLRAGQQRIFAAGQKRIFSAGQNVSGQKSEAGTEERNGFE